MKRIYFEAGFEIELLFFDIILQRQEKYLRVRYLYNTTIFLP